MFLVCAGLLSLFTLKLLADQQAAKVTLEFQAFLTAYEAKVLPLNRETNIAAFDASISGKEEDYKKSADLQVKLKTIWSNKEDFAKIKSFTAGDHHYGLIFKKIA